MHREVSHFLFENPRMRHQQPTNLNLGRRKSLFTTNVNLSALFSKPYTMAKNIHLCYIVWLLYKISRGKISDSLSPCKGHGFTKHQWSYWMVVSNCQEIGTFFPDTNLKSVVCSVNVSSQSVSRKQQWKQSRVWCVPLGSFHFRPRCGKWGGQIETWDHPIQSIGQFLHQT